MSAHHEYCMEQALKARADAEAAPLANVRERCLRSEVAWLEMAARAERSERGRAKIAVEKAERVAQEEAAHTNE